jgi:hypothetical protein
MLCPGCEGISIRQRTHTLLHRSTLYWSCLCLVISWIHCVFFVATISPSHQSIDPHCIFGGYTFLSIQLWIRSVFYGGHILLSLDHPSIGMPALGFEICHDTCWMFVCSFCQVLRVYTLAWTSTKYFSYQLASFNFILWGAFCYTLKLLN